MIRHKATGEFMPQLKRGRGYSHWNPSKDNTLDVFVRSLVGVPRLLASRRQALKCISQWNAMPNSKQYYSISYEGVEDYSVDIKSDGRSKDDLEVIEVNIEVVESETCCGLPLVDGHCRLSGEKIK